MRRGGTLGEKWDTRFLRRVREYGWFRMHEAEMIEAARRRRAEKTAAATQTKTEPATETETTAESPKASPTPRRNSPQP